MVKATNPKQAAKAAPKHHAHKRKFWIGKPPSELACCKRKNPIFTRVDKGRTSGRAPPKSIMDEANDRPVYTSSCDICKQVWRDRHPKLAAAKKEAVKEGSWTGCPSCLNKHPTYSISRNSGQLNKSCDWCIKSAASFREERKVEMAATLPSNKRYCMNCHNAKEMTEFTRFAIISGQVPSQHLYKLCNSCSNDKKPKERARRVEKKTVMADEKIAALVAAHAQGFIGCSHGCAIDWGKIKTLLVGQFGNFQGKRLYSMLLDWDHDNRLRKTADVSKIWNDDRRLLEINECGLLCQLCHRFKSWTHGDCVAPDSRRKTETRSWRRFHKTLLTEKLGRFINEGGCQGFDASNQCPFKLSIQDFFTAIKASHHDSDIESYGELLIMLAYDWDHLVPLKKDADVIKIRDFERRQEEIKKCVLRCCFCHRLKSYLSKDYVGRRTAVTVDEIDPKMELEKPLNCLLIKEAGTNVDELREESTDAAELIVDTENERKSAGPEKLSGEPDIVQEYANSSDVESLRHVLASINLNLA